MAKVRFYDDTEEILVGDAVDLITASGPTKGDLYSSTEGYEEILDWINDIVITVDTDSFIQRDKMIDNYKEAIQKYMKADLQDYFLSKITVDKFKITVPFKVYLAIDIYGRLRLALDNLGYYKNLNSETVEDEFTSKHNNLIQEYADFFTKLICKCTISTHYILPSGVYKELKEKYQYLENPKIGETGFLYDHELPRLREFLRGLECYDKGKEVKILSRPKDYIPSIVKDGDYKIEKEEYEPGHRVLDYIIFSLIFMRKAPLIVITRDYQNVELASGYDVYLTDNEGLIKIFVKSGSNFIVLNPFQWLDRIVEEQADDTGKDFIKERRDKYQDICSENVSLKEKLEKCSRFIEEKLSEHEKVEFAINTKNGQPYSITQIVTQCDPKKFHSTKESFSNPVTTTSIEEPGKTERRVYKSTKPLTEI